MDCCSKCGRRIPAIRLELLPDTPFCVGCSTTPAKKAAEVELDGPDARDLVQACSNQERT